MGEIRPFLPASAYDARTVPDISAGEGLMRGKDVSAGHNWYMDQLPFDETLSDLLSAFRLHGTAAGHSPRTMDGRESTVRRLGVAADVLSIDSEGLVSWLATLDLTKSSRATYRSHLRAFFSWMSKTHRRRDDPSLDIPSPKPPRGVPHPVSTAGVQAILAACSDPRAATTRAYVLLAAYEGLRVHEIAKVRGEDFLEGEVIVRGKGGVELTVPLHPVVASLAESMPSRGWWFPSDTAVGHVSRVTVSQAITRAIRRAGVMGATPHGLRHHFGTQVLRSSGGDLRTTQRALRHASPATTAIYTQVPDETLFRAISGIPAA